MTTQRTLSPNSVARTAAVLLLASLTLTACASTHYYTLPDGTSAYETQCTLWFQCTHEAKATCPKGYRLVRGPIHPTTPLYDEKSVQQPTRIDFACD